MSSRLELLIFIVVALPSAYAVFCLFCRAHNARRTASLVKDKYPEQWNELHALARHHPWAGIEVLIKQGILTTEEADRFRKRDEQLEKHAWLGILVSAVLGLLVSGLGSLD